MIETSDIFGMTISYPILIVAVAIAGFLAGIINAVAGGGSAITLPLMVEFGLPPALANGTNRPSILSGNLTAVFKLNTYIKWNRSTFSILIASVIGGTIGGYFSAEISDRLFAQIVGMAIVFISMLSHLNFLKKIKSRPMPWPIVLLLFGLVGCYGGMIQSGVGLLFLAVYNWCIGDDLLQANGLKAAFILIYTLPVLGLFMVKSMIDWPTALSLAVGSVLGTWTGAALAIKSDGKWISRIVLVISIVLGLKLWLYQH